MNHSELAGFGQGSVQAGMPPDSGALRAASARVRAARRARDQHFPHDLATGAGWDLLLDLHAEPGEIAACRLSPASRERWLRVLVEHGLASLPTDGSGDARLTDVGRARIDAYLAACLAQGLV